MPVLSFSLASRPAIHALASLMESFSSSSSSEEPDRMSPPSVTVIGGSSVMCVSISSYMSDRSCISYPSSSSSALPDPVSTSLISGVAPIEFLSAIMSFPFALPDAIRPARRSKS